MSWVAAMLAAAIALAPETDRGTAEPERTQVFMSVEALQRYCSAPDNDPNGFADLCVGYIAGVVDQLSLHAEVDFATFLNCPTRAITLGDFRDAFLDYTRRFPQEAEKAAAPLLEFTSSNLIICMLRNPVGA
jgi:hypothetical protein